ncbi:MAG: hypothetical protein K6G30_02500 [Acetatifactor sp.]|nr:hypothetical protein [Acetatifactor sp.]
MELEEFIKQIEREERKQAPKYLKDDIFAAIDIEHEERRKKRIQNARIYTWEVRLITAAAVLLIFLFPSIETKSMKDIINRQEPSVLHVMGEKSDELCNRIYHFSNKIIRNEWISIDNLENEEDLK